MGKENLRVSQAHINIYITCCTHALRAYSVRIQRSVWCCERADYVYKAQARLARPIYRKLGGISALSSVTLSAAQRNQCLFHLLLIFYTTGIRLLRLLISGILTYPFFLTVTMVTMVTVFAWIIHLFCVFDFALINGNRKLRSNFRLLLRVN